MNVLVLGGGVGGVVAATRLRGSLGREHAVTLVDRDGIHRFAPSYLWVLNGTRRPERVVRPLDRLHGVKLVKADVKAIRPGSREVATDQGPLPYDHLVVSLGAELAPEAVPGLSEGGETFYTLEGAQRLRSRLAALEGNRVAVVVCSTPFKCPAAPYEAALLMDSLLRRTRPDAKPAIDVYTPEKLPMAVAGPAVGNAVVSILKGRGIGFHPEHKVKRVEASARSLRFENGAAADYDLLAYVPPHRAPRAVADAGLTDASGYVPVDPGTMATTLPDVYAIGDVAAVRLVSGAMLPKAGVFAHGQAEVVARNIAARLAGRAPAARFDGHGGCWIETGDGRAAYGSGDFFATPTPRVDLHPPARRWHWGKVAFEKYWLWKWFR